MRRRSDGPGTGGGWRGAAVRASLVLVLFASTAAHAAVSRWLDVTVVQPREPVLVPGRLELKLDGGYAGLVPAAIPLSETPDGDPHELVIGTADGAYSFTVRLGAGAAGVALAGGGVVTSSCDAVKATAGVERGGVRPRLVLTLARAGEAACRRGARSIGVEETVHLRVASEPAGAEVYYASRDREHDDYELHGKAPAPLEVSLPYRNPVRIYFKKPGYRDCVRSVSLERSDGRRVLRVDRDKVRLGESPRTGDAPEVTCKLEPVPGKPAAR